MGDWNRCGRALSDPSRSSRCTSGSRSQRTRS